MFDRGANRGQGMRFQDGYAGGDGFMDRMSRMGQEGGYRGDAGYGPADGGYGAGITPEAERNFPQGGFPPNPGWQGYQRPMSGSAGDPGLAAVTARINQQLEEMKAIYERNAACVDEIREIIDGEDRRIRLMLEQAGQAADAVQREQPGAAGAAEAGASLDRIRELLDERAAEDRRIREEENVRREQQMEERHAEEQRRMEERANLENARREADAGRQEELSQTLSELQTELQNFSEQMNIITASVESVAGVAQHVSERADVTDKNTHDVGVRIYRNVQASMNDYLAKQTSTLDTAITGLNQRMEAMEDSFLHRKSAGTPLTVAALVASLVNLGVLVVYILTNY